MGCGEGFFLHFCDRRKWFDLYGLDAHGDYDSLSFLGENKVILAQDFEDYNSFSKYDVVTLWGVLEHLPSPNKVLAKCFEILNEKGKVLILIPNIKSRAFKLLGSKTPTINPREHINFFTSDSMLKLAHQNRFRIIGHFSELPIIDLMWPYVHDVPEFLDEINSKLEGYYNIYILEKN